MAATGLLQVQATAVAAYGLAGSRLELPDEPISDTAWGTLMLHVLAQRLVGFLAEAVDDGALPVTDEQREELEEAHAQAALLTLFLERELLWCADVFDAEGIEYRVLKGPAYAHTVYADPAVRSYGDIDVLVRSRDIDRTITTLLAAGATRPAAELRPGFDRRFSKGVTLVLPTEYQLDLHRTFVAGPLGLTVDLDSLFDRAIAFDLAGRMLPALAREERFLHACYHAALGNDPPRLAALRDVAEITLDEELDVDRVHAVMERWQARVVVWHAINTTWQTFELADITPLTVWAAGYRPSPNELRQLAVYHGPERSYASKAFRAVRTIPGVRAKAAYVGAHLVPKGRAGRPGLRRWRRGAEMALRGLKR